MPKTYGSRLRACLLGLAILCQPTWVAAEPFAQRFELIKKAASQNELYRLLFELPKGGDLHLHINLSIPAESWLAGATDPLVTKGNRFYTRMRISSCAGDKPPFILYHTIQQATFRRLNACQQADYTPLDKLSDAERAQWLSALKIDRPEEGRDEFFDTLGVRLGELSRDPYLVSELLIENLRQYAAEKVRYLEIQVVGPHFNDHEGTAIPLEQGVRILRERLQQPDARATGVTVRFLSAIVRFQNDAEQQLERAYAVVSQNRDLWVGVNITGKEEIPAGYGMRFLEPLRKLRRKYSGIPLSIHAGESNAPGQEVRTALLLGASRVGHGVNLLSDPDTLVLMRNSQYLIEINLLSNALLGYVPSLASHPFSEYLRLGVPVCLNTDDRTAWDSNLTDEYYAALTNFNLTWEEVVELGKNSLEHSFVESNTRAKLLKEYHTAISHFEHNYKGEDWRERLHRVPVTPTGYAERHWGIQKSQAPKVACYGRPMCLKSVRRMLNRYCGCPGGCRKEAGLGSSGFRMRSDCAREVGGAVSEDTRGAGVPSGRSGSAYGEGVRAAGARHADLASDGAEDDAALACAPALLCESVCRKRWESARTAKNPGTRGSGDDDGVQPSQRVVHGRRDEPDAAQDGQTISRLVFPE